VGHGVLKPSAECGRAETLPSSDANVDAFVREHQAELLNFFRGRVRRPQDAADLAQESWSRMMHYRLDTVASSRGLLFTIARNVLKNHWRWSALRQIEQSTDFAELEVSSDAPGPDRHLQASLDLEALEAAVIALPPKCRTVFLLSRIEGLSNAEVAQRCGISVKMVEKHLAKAIVACRAQVGDFDT
jgi:RNA polymerase sigma-70 factor (ECF subfamily)